MPNPTNPSREEYILKRLSQAEASANGTGRNVTQMHYARQNVITEEMEAIARSLSVRRSPGAAPSSPPT